MRRNGERRGNNEDRRRRKLKLLETYGDGKQVRCVWCRRWLTYETVQSDRIVAGGPYRFDNILPSCGLDNRKRQNLPAWKYAVRALRPTWLLLILKVPAAEFLYQASTETADS